MGSARLEREVDADNLSEPGKKIGKALAAQSRIAITRNGDCAGLVYSERRILKAPGLRADRVARIVLRRAGKYPAAYLCGFHHDFARSDDLFPLEVVLSVTTRSDGVTPAVDLRT